MGLTSTDKGVYELERRFANALPAASLWMRNAALVGHHDLAAVHPRREGSPSIGTIEDIDSWPPSEKKRILAAMTGELIPQIIIRAAERRGSVDEIVTRWIAHAYQPQPTDIRKLWADHFASVTDYWVMRARWSSFTSGGSG